MPARWPLRQDHKEEEAGGSYRSADLCAQNTEHGDLSQDTKGKTKADEET